MNAAIIGLGRMGLRHLQILRELGLPVAGASDQSKDAREKARTLFNFSPDAMFADPDHMLDSLKPELVVVATTAPSHEVLVCRAATAGARAILCEKPMATSVAACDRMIAACLKSGTKPRSIIK